MLKIEKDPPLFFDNEDRNTFFCDRCQAPLTVGPIFVEKKEDELVKTCGRCSHLNHEGNWTVNRQFLYEKALRTLRHLPCRHRVHGCFAELQWNDIEEHEKMCLFRTIRCPARFFKVECEWTGYSYRVNDHLSLEHADYFINKPIFEINTKKLTDHFHFTRTKKPNSSWIIMLKHLGKETIGCLVMGIAPTFEHKLLRYQVEVIDPFTKHSLVHRRPYIEPLHYNIFEDPAKYQKIQLPIIDKQLIVKIGIAKLSKQDEQLLQKEHPYEQLKTPPKPLLFNEALLGDFVCTVCREYMLGWIFVCPLGHNICAACHKHCPSCPCCRTTEPRIRNFSLEQFILKMYFPCRNRAAGCYFVDNAFNVNEHEIHCDQNSKPCVFDSLGCQQQLSMRSMIDHIHNLENHKVKTLNELMSISVLSKRAMLQEVFIFDNRIFVLKMSAGFKAVFQYRLQCMGNVADQYNYVLSLLEQKGQGLGMDIRHPCEPLIYDPQGIANDPPYNTLHFGQIEYLINNATLWFRLNIIKK